MFISRSSRTAKPWRSRMSRVEVERVDAVVGELAVVVEPERAGEPLQVGPAVRQLVDVEPAARAQHAPHLLERGVGIADVLEHAAREHRVERRVVIGQRHRVGRVVDHRVGLVERLASPRARPARSRRSVTSKPRASSRAVTWPWPGAPVEDAAGPSAAIRSTIASYSRPCGPDRTLDFSSRTGIAWADRVAHASENGP